MKENKYKELEKDSEILRKLAMKYKFYIIYPKENNTQIEMLKLNRESYQQLIEQDIKWIEKQPTSLERIHIIDILNASVDLYYPDIIITNEEYCKRFSDETQKNPDTKPKNHYNG